MKTADGFILVDGRPVRGHAVSDRGRVEIHEGPLGSEPDLRGIIVPTLVNAHTHCADAGVRPKPGMSLEELVAPPDGLKHRYLRETPRETLVADMRGFESQSVSNGISAFVDFREGGAEGCRMARDACDTGVILGRPVSKEYDPSEIDDILSVADGIALSSISDIDRRYAEKVAQQVHARGKVFAIHCSERVREDLDLVLSLEPAFLVHMVEATDPDLRRCVDMDIPIAVCPRSNRYFGKAPPLRRMKGIGNTVAMGSDNAMLCTPDLRPEAELFRNILGTDRDSLDWTWKCMTEFGTELLYRTRKITTRNNTGARYAVLPFEGTIPENAWTNGGNVPLL